ncbi:MAG: glycerophosphodiester phosphodiesterase family protein [Candidatus Krumholzibacteriales bacterium]
MAEAPENVEAAFELAFSYSADGIELDVQITADGVAVVFHDDTLRRITGRRGAVADSKIADLLKLDFGRWYSEDFRGQGLMTLESVLKRYAGRGILMIELKSASGSQDPYKYKRRLCTEVTRQIRMHAAQQMHDEIYILGFDAEMIEKCRVLAPELNYILNTKKLPSSRGLKTAESKNLRGYCMPRRKLTGEFAGQCRRMGLVVAVYSCNTPGQVSSALDKGADVIMTDDPGRVAKAFEQHVLSCQKQRFTEK